MGAILVDFVRLITLILLLPLVIIFVGPFLVLAALRGRQWLGPLTLDSTRYNFVGRTGIFMLGLAIWLLVWSGLVWLAFEATSPPVALVQESPANPLATVPFVEPTTTLTPTLTAIVLTNTPTSTPVPPTPTPTPTLGPIIPNLVVNSPTLTSVLPTFTSTPLFNETLATNTSIPTSNTVGDTLITGVPFANTERQAAIATVKEANLLLQDAIGLANETNIENLAAIWRGKALAGIADFAAELYDRYAKPFTVSFEFVTPPKISSQSSSGEVVITSREKWSYRGPSKVDEEIFEFTYTLIREDDRWVITKYRYLNLPLSTPTTTP